MKFRNKILLAIWGVVLGLLIVTYVIIQYGMRLQVQNRASQELRSNYRTIVELNALQNEEVAKSCQIIAETPRLKAVVELGDKNTALQLSRELLQNTLAGVFILTNAQGRPMVQITGGQPGEFPLDGLLPDSVVSSKRTSTKVWNIGTTVFRCATAPIIIGGDVVGTLTIGFAIDEADINTLHAMTNSDICVLVGSGPVLTSLAKEEAREIAAWVGANSAAHARAVGGEPELVSIATSAGLFEGTLCRLDAAPAAPPPGISYLLLRSVDREVQAALKPVMESFIILSAIVLAVTGVIGFIISKGITRPIAELVRGTAEVSRGNYDYRIEAGTGEELSFLAQKFEEMSRSLKEKVHQLAEQNTELEATLRRLKETQEELVNSERLAATGKLTAQLSHEINNPVHNIQSCLQTILKRLPPDSPDRELLEVAYEEVGRLARLTQQLLQVYRTSMVQEPRIAVHLNNIINEVLSASAQALRDGRVEVRTKFGPTLPVIQGSPDKLKQVFLNLVLNAKDAMPNGGILSVQTSRVDGNAVIHIADTGIGIPPENINRIFDAFFTTKNKVSGVGLGLSVTYGIIRQHAGTISVRSKVGEGTEFTLTIPITV